MGCGPVFPEGSTGAPAVACGSSSVSVEMSDESAVGQGFLTASMDAVAANGSSTASGDAAHAESQPEALSSGAFGVVEGDPVWWVAVQVGSEVAQVEITFADGSSDEMTPVGGIALLAHHIVATTLSTDPYSVKGSLTFTDASGNVLDTVTLPDVPTPMTVPLPVPASPSSTPPGAAANPGAVGSGTAGPAAGEGSASTDTSSSSAPGTVIACPMVPTAQAPSGATAAIP